MNKQRSAEAVQAILHQLMAVNWRRHDLLNDADLPDDAARYLLKQCGVSAVGAQPGVWLDTSHRYSLTCHTPGQWRLNDWGEESRQP